MKQQNFLFVGGIQEGKILAFPEAQPEIRFPVLPPQKVEPLGYLDTPPTKVEHKIERYFLGRLRADEDTFFLYRHESITISDVLKKLLAGYKPEAS